MDQHKLNVANAPKTSTFQMRINPEIKQQVENIYSRTFWKTPMTLKTTCMS